jgi:prophage antirepressor-like protein
MEIVKAFTENNMHTNIVIKGTYNEPLFRASDIGEILEMGNIRTSIQNFDNTERHVHSMDTSTGIKQVTFLTEKGLYKVLFKSRKLIAEKFQNWVCEVIKEIRLNGIYDLQKQLEIQKTEMEKLEDKKNQEYDIKLQEQKVLEREKILLKEYATIAGIIYIIKVKTYENKSYVIKLGQSSKGVAARYNEHKSKYDECLLLDCFAINKSKDFESFLHNHKDIRCNKVNDLIGHEKELELFLIGKNLSYQSLLNIINNNIHSFQYNMNELINENQYLKYKIENNISPNMNNNLLIEELIKTVKHLSNKVDHIEKQNKEILEKINSSQIKVTTGFSQPLVTLGPRLQQIHPGTLQLVKVYESVAECLKESNFVMKRPSIEKAINENIIYNGFRWLYVDRNVDSNIIHSINPTKITKAQNLGYIAQINKEETEIVNVYIDRKTAALNNGYESSSALDNPVKNVTLTKGFYYKLYESCDENLKLDFEKKINRQPLLYKDGIGQFDLDNNLVKEFICKYDCIKQLKISDKTLSKALDKNLPYNGYFYKRLNSQLKCL